MTAEKKQETEQPAAASGGNYQAYLVTLNDGTQVTVKARSQNEAYTKAEKQADSEGDK